jgi:hypothetical protein
VPDLPDDAAAVGSGHGGRRVNLELVDTTVIATGVALLARQPAR